MRILVFSDTHGRVQAAMEVYEKQEREEHVDLIVHLGDFTSDAKALMVRLGVSVVWVKGNMDGSYTQTDYEILETEYGKLFLCHGHMEDVKESFWKVTDHAKELGCKAALFGHTHVPVFREERGIYLLNPGSISLPASGQRASYAMLTTTKDRLTASVLFYEPAPKPQSGVLRDLLNNSDRF